MGIAGARVYNHAGGLVDDEEGTVFENNLQRHDLGSHLRIDLQPGFDLDPLPTHNLVFGPWAATVHLDRASLDPAL